MYNLMAEGTNSPVLTYVIMGVLLVAIIALFVWQSVSGKKKQKEAQQMVDSMKIGDRVKTIGGVCGFLVEINNNENTIVIETGNDKNKSYVKFDKGAIYQTGPANPSVPEKEDAKAEEPAIAEPAAAEETAETAEQPAEEKPAKEKKKNSKKADK